MRQIHKPLPVKLIMSIFTQRINFFDTIEKILIRKIGTIDFCSQIIDFNQTPYYENEFGTNLKRRFISFKRLIQPDNLWKIKIMTNNLERRMARDGKRLFNIDPGYITQANLVLATTKEFSHRIYVKKGIYQEVTLIFKNGAFIALPWTYPDYQNKELIDIFVQIRHILRLQLKNNAKPA